MKTSSYFCCVSPTAGQNESEPQCNTRKGPRTKLKKLPERFVRHFSCLPKRPLILVPRALCSLLLGCPWASPVSGANPVIIWVFNRLCRKRITREREDTRSGTEKCHAHVFQGKGSNQSIKKTLTIRIFVVYLSTFGTTDRSVY